MFTLPTPEGGFSTDPRAEQFLGRRETAGPIGIILDWPVELGYQCPVLGHQQTVSGVTVDAPPTLHWSEYNACLWCQTCNRDYPSTICTGFVTDDPAVIDRAVEVFFKGVAVAAALAVAAPDNPKEQS